MKKIIGLICARPKLKGEKGRNKVFCCCCSRMSSSRFVLLLSTSGARAIVSDGIMTNLQSSPYRVVFILQARVHIHKRNTSSYVFSSLFLRVTQKPQHAYVFTNHHTMPHTFKHTYTYLRGDKLEKEMMRKKHTLFFDVEEVAKKDEGKLLRCVFVVARYVYLYTCMRMRSNSNVALTAWNDSSSETKHRNK